MKPCLLLAIFPSSSEGVTPLLPNSCPHPRPAAGSAGGSPEARRSPRQQVVAVVLAAFPSEVQIKVVVDTEE